MYRCHRNSLAGLMLAATLSTSGCSVGPDYEWPDLTDRLQAQWQEAATQSGPQEISRWWQLLGDAEMIRLIERGISGSLTLADTRERIIGARARRGITNADRLPQLDVGVSYERVELGDDGFVIGGAPAGLGADLYSLGAVAGWELDLWGRVGRLVESAEAEIEVAIEDYRAARVVLAAEIAREVISIRALDEELAIVASSIEAYRDTLEITQSRERAGFANSVDVSRAQRVLESTLAVEPDLRSLRRSAELRLALLIGERPGAVRIVQRGAIVATEDLVPAAGVPADLLLRRPDLRSAERALAAATARIGAAKAERYPRASLSGSIALQGPDVDDMFNPQAFVLSAGPSITLPIFEGGRIKSRVLQAESEERRALIALQQSILEAMTEVETAIQRRIAFAERADRLLAAEEAALDTEALATDRYQAGAADFLSVTEARTQRLAIARSRVLAERETLLRLVDLYAALGGGWDPPQLLAVNPQQPQE